MLRPVFAKMKLLFSTNSDFSGKEGIAELPRKKKGGQSNSGSIPILFQVSRWGKSQGTFNESTLHITTGDDMGWSRGEDVEKNGRYQHQQRDALDIKNCDEEDGWVKRKGGDNVAVKVTEIEVRE